MSHHNSTILLLIVLLSCVSGRAQYMPDLYPYNPHASSYTHDTIDYQYTRYKGRYVPFLAWSSLAPNQTNNRPWIPNWKYSGPQWPYHLLTVKNEDSIDVYGVAIAAYAYPVTVDYAPHEATLMLEWEDKNGVTRMDSGVFSFFSPCTNSIFRYEAVVTSTDDPTNPTDVRDTIYLPVFEVYFDTVRRVTGNFRVGSWLPRNKGTIVVGWLDSHFFPFPQDSIPVFIFGEDANSAQPYFYTAVGWRSIFAITGPDVPVAYAPRRLWLEGTDAAGWSPQCGVEGYELETARVSGVVDTLEWPVALDFVTDTAAPLPPMSADSVYRLRVRSVVHHTCPHHDTVVRSPWSEPLFMRGGHDIGIGRVCAAGAPLSASPNPATDRLDVRCAPGSSLALRDSQGRTRLRASAPDGCASLRLDGLPSGLYLLTTTAPSATATIKVLKR